MASPDLSNLLLSIASALAAAATAAPGSSAVALGSNLFVHDLPASATTSGGPAAVLRIYGGPIDGELRPVPSISVQCMVHAADAAAGLQLARRLYDALHDPANSGRPRQTWTVDALTLDADGDVVADASLPEGWDVRLITLPGGGPAVIGRTDATSGGQSQISFNFDARFTAP